MAYTSSKLRVRLKEPKARKQLTRFEQRISANERILNKVQKERQERKEQRIEQYGGDRFIYTPVYWLFLVLQFFGRLNPWGPWKDAAIKIFQRKPATAWVFLGKKYKGKHCTVHLFDPLAKVEGPGKAKVIAAQKPMRRAWQEMLRNHPVPGTQRPRSK